MASLDFMVYVDGDVNISPNTNLDEDRREELDAGGDPDRIAKHVTLEFEDERAVAAVLNLLGDAHDLEITCGTQESGSTGVETLIGALIKIGRDLPK